MKRGITRSERRDLANRLITLGDRLSRLQSPEGAPGLHLSVSEMNARGRALRRIGESVEDGTGMGLLDSGCAVLKGLLEGASHLQVPPGAGLFELFITNPPKVYPIRRRAVEDDLEAIERVLRRSKTA